MDWVVGLLRLYVRGIISLSLIHIYAASAAIYGARAAEGVVLVTTKKGTSEKVKVEYTGNFSFITPTRLPESNTGLDHALLSNVAFTNAGLAVPFSQKAIEDVYKRQLNTLFWVTRNVVLTTVKRLRS